VCDHEVYSWSAQLGRKVHRLGGVLTQWYISLNYSMLVKGVIMKKKLYDYCKDEYYRSFGPLLWDCDERSLTLRWKNKDGEYVVKELIRRKLD